MMTEEIARPAGTIDYEARDGRAYITLNNPSKKNAMTDAMWDALMEAYDRAEADDDVRVIVLTGAGTDFCTGHDMAEVGNQYGPTTIDAKGRPRRPSQRARLRYDKKYVARFERIFTCLTPTIALVRGYCLGGGLYLAEACDLVIASDTAKMGHPEQKLGLSGAAYFDAWEMLTLGIRKARELLLMADVWNAQEAFAAGLINKLVSDDELTAKGEEWAERIARLPRDGITIGKSATLLAMNALGVNTQFAYGPVYHALASNMRWEEDEVNFFKQKRDKGVTAANKEREARYVVKDGDA
ncbi:enoyl-CoA hydratase/isomerase family protein [Sphingobium sp. 15-1]|uniref:enoyl-CoA hydratase/isomerase family protein n=1 Tax=Sphingobium sp. 15-1 TaxID=2729616 RepID=UPI001C3F9757|nr:enoyl-CoA hydratase/isomerase family protein [Sphingobium sp. 15-1]